MTFQDHFSRQAADYARFRPVYPAELFEYLAGLVSQHNLAWDCATGNGQAAIALARHFEKVIATDASSRQIEQATPNRRVMYQVAPAERSGIAASTCDLVTVAQALHWFDLNAFYAEAKRVVRPGGGVAAWHYNLLQIAPEIDAVVNHFYHDVVGAFWPSERAIIERGYGELPFPFDEIIAPPFRMTAQWSLHELLGYLRTWSATQRYEQMNHNDPVTLIEGALREIWVEPESKRTVVWPLFTRVGRNSD